VAVFVQLDHISGAQAAGKVRSYETRAVACDDEVGIFGPNFLSDDCAALQRIRNGDGRAYFDPALVPHTATRVLQCVSMTPEAKATSLRLTGVDCDQVLAQAEERAAGR
jgi:hypothetical protein